jgi:hypothetical protein
VNHRKNVREVIASAKIALGLGQNSQAEEARLRRSGQGERREQSEEEVPS